MRIEPAPPDAPLSIAPPRHPVPSGCSRRRWGRAAVLLLSAALLAGCSRGEQSALDASAADDLSAGALTDDLVSGGESARRVAAHHLTADRVERWFVAQEQLDAVLADDPALEARVRGSGGVMGRGEDAAIAQAVARLGREPAARDAVTSAGLSVSDFVLTGLALHQALLASGPAAPAPLRRLAARNVQFVTQHAELLQRYADQRPRHLAAAPPPPDTLFYDYTSGVDTIVQDVGGDVDTVGVAMLDSLDRADSLAARDSSLGLTPIFPRGARDSAGVARRDTASRRTSSDSAARPPTAPPPQPAPPPAGPPPRAPLLPTR